MIDALYVHIPFCRAKCYYCDFNSFPGYSAKEQEKYVKAVVKEAYLRSREEKYSLETIFLGGGTPTCLDSGLLCQLIDSLRGVFPCENLQELTIEANPGTLTEAKLSLLKKAGVNRISLGVQSFQDIYLKSLGRIHTANGAVESFFLLKEAGFDNVNIDLMYGLPGQSLGEWEKDLKKAVALAPEHISLYQLKIEEGTVFGRKLQEGFLTEFDDEVALEMYKLGRQVLQEEGYLHYEISNFAKEGYQSRHNQKYWRTKPYLGLGAGAHSFLPPLRVANLGNIAEYIEALLVDNNLPPQIHEKLSFSQGLSETMFMGLRLLEGVNIGDFKDRYGHKPQEIFPNAVQKCLERGLIELDSNTLKLSDKGLYLGNLVFEEFLL